MRRLLAGLSLIGVVVCARATAAEPSLTLAFGGEGRRYQASELLARPDARSITIPGDVSYKRAMTYRGVPLLDLLEGLSMQGVGTIEARATDGFASQIPLALVEKAATGGSTAWVAVEDARAPWPSLPGKMVSAGPFYLVWQHPERSGVGQELWPYRLGSLTGVKSPALRWPQMAVDASLPADAPERRGQAVFTEQCMSCHRMKGAGAADIGPDLGEPMGPTEYFKPEALRRVIRDPKSLRNWPGLQMPGFDRSVLPDADLDALVAYLDYMASR
jgi:mono/diheme cytochrome c family protein